jgi:hypothetical protein
VDEHVSACAECRAELRGLQATRHKMQAWEMPASLGPTLRRAPRLRPTVLAWAASVALAFAAGLGLASAGVSVEGGRLALGTRTEERVKRLLAEQEARHRVEMEAVQARAALPSDDVLRHVERLVAEAEARQAERVDARLVTFAERLEGQRREDMQRVSAGLALLEGQTNHDLARATELMGYVLQASAQASR